MVLPPLSWVLFGGLALSWFTNIFELVAMLTLRLRRKIEPPTTWPGVSIIKPLAGHDDELEQNLWSHLAIEYPGEWELIIGVKDDKDPAWEPAKKFAEAHSDRVQLFRQDSEPGLNPKVNQLITLTRHAKYEVIALTDSNVRVPTTFLTEHAAFLARPKIGLTSNAFIGVGERSLGSRLDNLTLASFVWPNVATGDALHLQQIIAKSIAIKREALVAVGGWEHFKDLLAEDQRLGRALKKAGYRTLLCRTPVVTVQKSQGLGWYWARHTRWAMIRFIVLPGVYLEPLLNPVLMSLPFALSAWWEPRAWGLVLASALYSMLMTQVYALLGRGHGFSLATLLLVPLRDLLSFAMWIRGAFLRKVSWRGNPLRVGKETRLSRD